MNNRSSAISILAVVLVTAIAMPVVFFMTPRKASAGIVGGVSCLLGAASGAAAVKGAIMDVPVFDVSNLVPNSVTSGATTGNCIETGILMPLARLVAHWLLQAITASTIDWINGGNGTGQSSFVQNLSTHLQGVADIVARTFIANLEININSPFGLPISIALTDTYNKGSSMGGFFAANKCTLNASSNDPNGFLVGDWSKGGAGAWLGLTTQDQNNPYALYQRAQAQLALNIGDAQTNRRQDLIQGMGFLSWCPGNSTDFYSGTTAADAKENAILGVSADTPCYDTDTGQTLPAKTPGSVIHDYTQKIVVGSGIDQLVSAQDLDNSLFQIINALVTKVLNTGLAAASDAWGDKGNQSLSAYVKVQQKQAITDSAAGSASQLAQARLSDVQAYEDAWQNILYKANEAQVAAQGAADTCTANGYPSMAADAQVAIQNEINPVIAQAQSASDYVLSTKNTSCGIIAIGGGVNATCGSVQTSGAIDPTLLASGASQLQTMPPSAIEVQNAQVNAQQSSTTVAPPDGGASFGGATSVAGSPLTVTGGTLVDQMTLLYNNAVTIKNVVCIPPVSATP